MNYRNTCYAIVIFGSGLLIGRWSHSFLADSRVGQPIAAAVPAVATRPPQRNLEAGPQPNLGLFEDAEWVKQMNGPDRAAAFKQKTQAVLSEKNPAIRLRLFAVMMGYFKPGDYEAIKAGFSTHDQQGRLFPPEYNLMLQTAGVVDGEAVLTSIFNWYAQHQPSTKVHLHQPVRPRAVDGLHRPS